MTLGSTHNVKAIKMKWMTSAIGGTTPTVLYIGSASLSEISSGDVDDWTIDVSNIATGITLTNTSGAEILTDNCLEWTIDGVVNPDISQWGDATPGCISTNPAGGMGDLTTGVGYIAIQTYDDTNMMHASKKDNVTIPFTVTTNPDLGNLIVTKVVNPAPIVGDQPYFFCQRPDQPYATKIANWFSSYQPAVGDILEVWGKLDADNSGIHIIREATVNRLAQSSILPKSVGINNYNTINSLMPFGQRVKVWGKVQKPNSEAIETFNGYSAAYLDDGAAIQWPASNPPVNHCRGVRLLTVNPLTLSTINNSDFFVAEGVLDLSQTVLGKRPIIWIDP